MPHFSKRMWIIIGSISLVLLCCGVFATGFHDTSTSSIHVANSSDTKAPKTSTVSNSKATTETPTALTSELPPAQRAQVVDILTKNINHYEQVWKDGQAALGSTQYATAEDGVAAFDDPKSAASRFSNYRQKEDPASDMSFQDAFSQADALYTGNVSDDPLSNWRNDVIQLTDDMETWVQDGVQWQIQEITTSKLNSDMQVVSNDFAAIRKDISEIGK